jgi:hypothetical protein
MSWTGRASVAILLVVACVALPVVLDQCATSCEAHASSSAAPRCHHNGSSTERIGRTPAPCGHDHHGPVATAAVAPSPASRPLVPMLAVIVDPMAANDLVAHWIDAPSAVPSPIAPSHTLARPLRI